MVEHLSESTKKQLRETVTRIFRGNKGILAADERAESMKNKLENNGIENTADNRRKLRNLLFDTPGLEEYVSGVIMNEETFTQYAGEGEKPLHKLLLEKDILVGLKLDEGLRELKSGEKVSKGLDNLEEKLKNLLYNEVKFTKWRSVFSAGENSPSAECLWENAHVLCQYASKVQKSGRVPIIEPEILYENSFSERTMLSSAKNIYSVLLCLMHSYGIYLPGVIFKVSFITTGRESKTVLENVGPVNSEALLDTLPRSLGGVLFLSGGHTLEESCKYLSDIKRELKNTDICMSFSFARALTDGVITEWGGDDQKYSKAQKVLINNLFKACNM